MLLLFISQYKQYYNDFYHGLGPRAIGGRVLQCERQSVCGYMMKIAINSRFEQVNIVAFGKSTS